jgi:hypothetical protein
MDWENTSEFFYEKLKNTTNPGTVLAAHFGSLYNVDVTKSIIILCNRLIKVFGRFTVFFAILDMAGSYPNLTDNPYPLLYTICKRKFEAAHGDLFTKAHEPLDAFLSSIDKELRELKKKKTKAPSSEGL